MADIKLI